MTKTLDGNYKNPIKCVHSIIVYTAYYSLPFLGILNVTLCHLAANLRQKQQQQHEKLILNIIVSILNLVNIFALTKTNRKNNLKMVIAQLDIVCRVENVKF